MRALALALMVLAACGDATSQSSVEGARRSSVVQVSDLNQLEAALEAERGKALLVNFWAVW